MRAPVSPAPIATCHRFLFVHRSLGAQPAAETFRLHASAATRSTTTRSLRRTCRPASTRSRTGTGRFARRRWRPWSH
jgi:hypothetical protein